MARRRSPVILDMQKFETLDAERVVNTNTDDDVERVFDRAAERQLLQENNLTIKHEYFKYTCRGRGGVCDDNYELDF
jgi:hypothetical protein